MDDLNCKKYNFNKKSKMPTIQYTLDDSKLLDKRYVLQLTCY
jgi:hypothetical protein